MNFFSAMEVLSSGLGAERVRMNITASNLANANTTRTAEGGPYQRRDPVFIAEALDPRQAGFSGKLGSAVQLVSVAEVVRDQSAPKQVYNPGHPDANGDGYVAMPNIETVEEMVNMVTSSRAYEAGVSSMSALMEMARKALNV